MSVFYKKGGEYADKLRLLNIGCIDKYSGTELYKIPCLVVVIRKYCLLLLGVAVCFGFCTFNAFLSVRM